MPAMVQADLIGTPSASPPKASDCFLIILAGPASFPVLFNCHRFIVLSVHFRLSLCSVVFSSRVGALGNREIS